MERIGIMRALKIFFCIILLVFLHGCELVYLNEKDPIDSATNLEEIFHVNLGYTRAQIVDSLGDPTQESFNSIEYKGIKTTFYFNDNSLSTVISSNKNLTTDDGIKMNSTREQIIKHLDENKDLYEFIEEDGDNKITWIYTVDNDDVKIIYKLKEQKVSQIIISTDPLSTIFTNFITDKYGKEAKDEEIINDSTYINANVYPFKNNRIVLNENFLQYASIGLIENIPVPIGININDVISKYGIANYIIDTDDKMIYWYKEFNSYFVVNKDNEYISEIILPIELEKEQITTRFSTNVSYENDDLIIIDIKDYQLVFYGKDTENIYNKLVLKKK